MTIRDRRAWAGPLRGSVGLGETYAEGLWETDDLVSLLRIAARALRELDGIKGTVARPRGWLHRLRHLVPENTRRGARNHVAAHYDLGNELFGAFLDERMVYSCAWFPHPGAGLEQAQLAKLERVCRRLQLGPDEPPAGDRRRLGRAGDPRRRRARLPGDDDDDLARASASSPCAGSRRPGSGTG